MCMPRRQAATRTWVWLIPAALSAALSAYAIGRTPLWRDEMATWEFARLSLSGLFAATGHVDRILLPYYLVMHLWTAAGTSAVWLRMPSAIAAVLTAGLTARIGQRVWSDTAGVVAGVALATNSAFARTSVEARPYALALLLCVIATALALTATADSRIKPWIGYAAASAAAMLMEAYALLSIIAHGALLLDRDRHRSSRNRQVAAAVVAIVLAAPLVVSAYGQRAQIGWIPQIDLANAVLAAESQFGSRPEFILVILGAVLVAVRQLRIHRMDAPWAMAVGMAVLPPVGLFIGSRLLHPMYQDRYMVTVPVGSALLLGAAAHELRVLAAGQVRSRHVGVAGIAAICAVLAVGANFDSLDLFLRSGPFADNFPKLGRSLARVLAVGDTVVVDQWYYAGGFAAGVAYYTRDASFLSYQLAQLPHGASTVFVRTVTGVDPLRTRAAKGAPSHGRTWLITLSQGQNALRETGLARSCRRPSPQPSPKFGDIHLIRLSCG